MCKDVNFKETRQEENTPKTVSVGPSKTASPPSRQIWKKCAHKIPHAHTNPKPQHIIFFFSPMTTHKDMLACNMSTTSTRRRPRRSVVFDESVSVTETLHINDYTCQEIQACWPTCTEQQVAYFQRQRILCQWQEGTYSTTAAAASNFRGLEGRTRKGMDMKRQRRARAIFALLEEQALQVSESGSVCNRQAMANVYRHQCHTSLADALVLARLDREQVLQDEEEHQQPHVLPKKHSRTLSSDSSTSTSLSSNNNSNSKTSTGRRPRKIFRRWLGSNIA